MTSDPLLSYCPINEMAQYGRVLGRCWHYLPDGVTCPRHGDVSAAVKKYTETGELTMEIETGFVRK